MKKKMENEGAAGGQGGQAGSNGRSATVATTLPAFEYRTVPYSSLLPDPDQPRKTFAEASLKEMADSIREKGIIQDLILELVPAKYRLVEPDLISDKWRVEERMPWFDEATREHKANWDLRCEDTETECRTWIKDLDRSDALESSYRIVCGERRWRGAGIVGLAELPAKVYTGLTPEQRFVLQMIENNQRENVSALEEAAALQRQLEERRRTDATFSPEKLAAEMGMSRAGIYERLKLNRLQPKIREALVDGTISTSIAQELAKVPTLKLQQDLLKRIEEQSRWHALSVRDVQKIIDNEYVKPLKDAPFDAKATYPNLLPCDGCPHRTGNMLNEFPDLKSRPNVCTNLECYLKKVTAKNEEEAKAAELKGITTITEKELEKNSDKYVRPDQTNYRAPGCKSWATLMGKHKPKPVLVLGEEGPIEVYKMEEAQQALKANGVKLVGSGGGYSDEDKKRAKKKIEMEATAKAATGQVLTALVTNKGIDSRLWRPLADGVAQLLSIDRESFIAKRRGLAKVINEVRDGLETWLTGSKEQPRTDQELQAFIVEALLCAPWNDGYDPKFSDEFKDVCRFAGGTPDELAADAAKADAKQKQTDNQQLMDGLGAVEVKPKKGLAAKLEKAKAKLPGLSAGNRAKILAAQKARWAKIKAAKA